MKIAQEEWHRKPASYLLSNYTTAICRVAFLSLVRNRYSSLLCIQCLKLARRFIALPTSSQVSSRWIHCIDLKIASNNDSTLLHAVQTQESERERERACFRFDKPQKCERDTQIPKNKHWCNKKRVSEEKSTSKLSIPKNISAKWVSPWNGCSHLKCLQQKLASLASKVVVVVLYAFLSLQSKLHFSRSIWTEFCCHSNFFLLHFGNAKVDAVNTNHSNSIWRAKDWERTL